MALPKKEDFTLEDQNLAVMARALSHPARIHILRLLSQHQQLTCGDIVMQLPLAQSTVSRHLQDLLAAGLVLLTAEGKRSLYQLNQQKWDQDTTALKTLFGTALD